MKSPTGRQNVTSISEHFSFCHGNLHPSLAAGAKGGPWQVPAAVGCSWDSCNAVLEPLLICCGSPLYPAAIYCAGHIERDALVDTLHCHAWSKVLPWSNLSLREPQAVLWARRHPRWHLKGSALKCTALSRVPGYFRNLQTKPSSARWLLESERTLLPLSMLYHCFLSRKLKMLTPLRNTGLLSKDSYLKDLL